MGLLKAGLGAISGVLADQWKEFFYCDSLDKTTLVVKGQKRISNRSSNTRGNDNIISNGSGIAVADGQCMMIVEQGKIVEVCAEPGEYTYDSSTEPSIFSGSLGDAILETFKLIGKRFTYGGDTGKDQRVYYFNTKEILDNKFGTANPVMFRVVDSRINLDIDVSLRCNGVFSYKIVNPLLFYTNVCGNVASSYERTEIDSTLKTEFISSLQPALAKLSDMELRPNQIIAHNREIELAMNEVLSETWGSLRGIEVVNVALGSVTLPEEDQELIKTAQKAAMYMNPAMANASRVEAENEAMKTAAGNAGGAAVGFMGMNLAQNAGGTNSIQMAQQIAQQNAQQAAAADGWTCSCGKVANGNFCPNCGAKKPAPAGEWICPKCGNANSGKFCGECGEKKPEADGAWICPKCGKSNTGKFCSECGEKKPEAAAQ